MDMIPWWYAAIVGLGIGFILGSWGQARRWREVGNHEYMNRMASGRHLYQVKREK